jgi:hypothetical protein
LFERCMEHLQDFAVTGRLPNADAPESALAAHRLTQRHPPQQPGGE